MTKSRQILHHLTDVAFLLHGRLKKLIAEPMQVVWVFNPDEWNIAFGYLNAQLNEKKQVYSLFREMNYQLIDNYFEEYFKETHEGSETLGSNCIRITSHERRRIG